MTPGEWIALSGLLFIIISTNLSFWIFVKVKLKELDMKSDSNKMEIDILTKRTIEETGRLDMKVDSMLDENKKEHKELLIELKELIQIFNDFRVYVEKK